MGAFLKNIDVVILCGGLGTRLQSILPDHPKILAPLGKHNLLDVTLEQFKDAGASRIILCVGHQKEKIKEYVEKNYPATGDLKIVLSEEATPLGTGGALRRALSLVQSDTFLVMNGDSLADLNLAKFLNWHHRKNALFSMALMKAERADGGAVVCDKSQRILSFREKTHDPRPHFVNAGFYIMGKDAARMLPDCNAFSLEHDFFPKLVEGGKCFGYLSRAKFLDIGTPERYQKAVRSYPNSFS